MTQERTPTEVEVRIAEALDATNRGDVFRLSKTIRRGYVGPPKGAKPKQEATRDPATIARWVAAGFHYGVIPRPELFVADVDAKNGGDRTLADLVAEHGALPPTPTVETPSGGLHIWLAMPRGVRISGKQGGDIGLPGIDIVARTGSPWQVAGVGSVRPDGVYRWRAGLSTRDVPIAPAPDWLVDLLIERGVAVREGETNETTADSFNRKPSWNFPPGFSSDRDQPKARTRRPQFKPRTIREGERNATLWSHACRMRRFGAEHAEILAELHAIRAGCCETGSHPVTDAELESMATRAVAYPVGGSRRDFSGARRFSNELRQAIAAGEWRGMAGATDRKLLLALVALAERIGSTVLSVSERQAAELAGTTRKTTHAAIWRLRAAGWLDKLTTGIGTQASTFELKRPVRQVRRVYPTRQSKTVRERRSGVTVAHDDLSRDAYRWRGLGANAALVLGALDEDGGLSARAIAAATGVSPTTTRRVLARLAAHALAEKDDDGRWRRGAGELDDVEKLLASAGDGVRQREQHAIEREGYVRYRAMLRQAWLDRCAAGRSRAGGGRRPVVVAVRDDLRRPSGVVDILPGVVGLRGPPSVKREQTDAKIDSRVLQSSQQVAADDHRER